MERGISMMNSLCKNLQNQLSQSSFDSVMRICKEGDKELSNGDLEELVEWLKKQEKKKKIDL